MDSFLKEIDTELLKRWLLNQNEDDWDVKEVNDNIVIETKYGLGSINFYPNCIIELDVENKMTKEKVFFIHFQMNNFHHALGLLYDMRLCLQTLTTTKKTRVLLSCTSGLTTGFFAEKLNEGVQLLNKDFEFNAVSYGNLYDMAKDYDVILLAPQVSFRLSEVEGVLKNKRVYALSPALFGKYDVGNTITFLEDELYKEKEVQSQQENPLPIKQMLKAHQQVLALAFIQLDQKVRLVSRLYDENNMILEDFEVYKNTISVDDIVDLINTILYGYPDIELISLSLPGVVYNGVVTLKKYGLNECHLQAFLEEKYSQKIVINNDVNTIVMGYFASQDDYESISFLYQARIGGTGGVGHIHRGHLIKGRHNIAGEIQYLPISFSDNYQEIKKTPEGALEWTTKYCLGITSMVSPDAIIIYNKLIAHSEDVKKEMEKYMPKSYIPDLIKIESLKEYMLIGCILLGLKEM